MAQRNSSGRGGTATRTRRQAGNQTPGTPEISESEIARMRVDEIRGQLRRREVGGISALRKPELVKLLARTLRSEGRAGGGAAKRSTGPSGRPAAAGRAPTGRKATTAAKAGTSARSTASAAKAGTSRGGGIRTGRASSKSLRYAQVISSLEDRPERPGRSLVTTNHEVIQRWARARSAKPATIAGTERGTRAGVLTFDLPGYRASARLRQITWAEWFRTFDSRRLNLIYQEQLRDGRPSNFFRTESPDREDG